MLTGLIPLPESWWPAFKRGFILIGVLMPVPMAAAVLRDYEVATAARDVGVALLIVLISAFLGGLAFALPALLRGFLYRFLSQQ